MPGGRELSGSNHVSVLVITAWPDERRSTQNLALIVDEIDRRPDASAQVWYLRTTDHQVPATGTRVVDSLRTWPPCAALDAVGLRAPAAWIRGRRIRWWLRRVHPDIVVLDDGLGEHVLAPLPSTPAIVVRRNELPPAEVQLEPTPRRDAELLVVPPSDDAADSGGDGVYVEYPFAGSDIEARTFADPGKRGDARRTEGLPQDAPLVVGWGDDGWLDGPDLFLRTLWALEQRHGRLVHGAWFGLTADPHEVDRLRSEADRLGLADRFHHRDRDTLRGRLCGDAALFPYRSTAHPGAVRDAILAGELVVAFEATGISDPVARVVRDLDVDAAASALDAGLDEDRNQRWRSSLGRVDVELLADRLLALAR